DDFSGREYQDQYVAMMGVPHTPDEHLAVAEKRLEFERNSGPSRFLDAVPASAPFGALLLFTPAAPLGGLMLAKSALGPSAVKSVDSGTLELLGDQVKELRAQKAKADEMAAKGLQPGDEEYDKVMERVGVLTSRMNTA